MLSQERLGKVMTKPWRQATSFPMIDSEDNFGITAEHYRHCRRFCDGQSARSGQRGHSLSLAKRKPLASSDAVKSPAPVRTLCHPERVTLGLHLVFQLDGALPRTGHAPEQRSALRGQYRKTSAFFACFRSNGAEFLCS
jgi:hypothetical protein